MDNIQKRLNCCVRSLRNVAKKDPRRVFSNRMLFGEEYVSIDSESRRDYVAKSLFVVLEHRQKNGKYGIDYQRYYYYKAVNGRMAYVSRSKAYNLIKKGLIVDFEATKEIPNGVYVKHRRIIESLDREGRRMPSDVKKVLEEYFDERKPCKMIIDTNFKIAYDPEYHGCASTDGDLANEESCMSERGYEAQRFYGGIDGCKVARFETDDGEQVGRCIVYEYNNKRHFIRVYGRGAYHRTMLNMIKDSMNDGDLFGRDESLSGMKLETNWTNDTPNMYLDGNRYGLSCIDGEWFVGTNYDYDGKSTSSDDIGDVYDKLHRCKYCGNVVNENDAYWCGDYVYCDDECASSDGWQFCERCGEAFDEDDSMSVISGDHAWCCEHCANRDGFYQCDVCGEYVEQDELYTTSDGETKVCSDCVSNSEVWSIDEDGYAIRIDNKNEEDENE